MENSETTNKLLKQLTDGLSEIMKLSYPFCKNENAELSIACSKINNSAFELKRITELLQKQIGVKE